MATSGFVGTLRYTVDLVPNSGGKHLWKLYGIGERLLYQGVRLTQEVAERDAKACAHWVISEAENEAQVVIRSERDWGGYERYG